MKNLQCHVVFNSFFANSMLIVTQPLKENEVPGEIYYHYFSCTTCKTKTSILNNTVLSNSNTKLSLWYLYLFCDNHTECTRLCKKKPAWWTNCPQSPRTFLLSSRPKRGFLGPQNQNPRAQRIKICRIPLTLNNLWPLTLGVSFATIAINVAMNIVM